ncbi:DUF4263 domain-containing protein [Aquabacterium sp. A7-Y]|uniref:Shedu immune nuclease family protein n=1 Tax=Aquabacterium sp. A7-Y TaxID=1349605 RepID=UPI00223E5DDD|nr:Shedu immune nuclease family protein [Aquabacterium sp. A7-Y]MCW7540979.1 DUF4263 domain-containing protein [Aquabacterium sp. A7-Y]
MGVAHLGAIQLVVVAFPSGKGKLARAKSVLRGQREAMNQERFDLDDDLDFELDDQSQDIADIEEQLFDEADQTIEPWAFNASLTAATIDGRPCAEIYAHGTTQFPRKAQHPFRRELLARVTASEIVAFPLVSAPYRHDFLEPKYDPLKRIRIPFSSLGINGSIPKSVEEFDELLTALPTGFTKYARLGLGLKRAYKLIPEALARDDRLSEMLLTGGDTAEIHGSVFHLGIERFDLIRRSIDRITDRSNAYSLRDRRLLTFNELLHRADPTRFGRAVPRARPGEIFELVQLRGRAQNLSPEDRQAAASVVEADAEKLVKETPRKLLGLKAVIELVTLKELIGTMEEMLARNLTEPRWQAFFKDNPFILSLAFPHPVILVEDQASVGGTLLSGKGESVADFLLQQRFTGGLALIEIKRPSSKVLEKDPFRGDLFAPHRDLTSAIAQVLDQRTQLHLNFTLKAQDPKLKDTHISSVSCVVVIGTTPNGIDQQRSFDLYRHSTRDVAIVTFDELLGKLKEILRLLTPLEPPPAQQTAPPESID